MSNKNECRNPKLCAALGFFVPILGVVIAAIIGKGTGAKIALGGAAVRYALLFALYRLGVTVVYLAPVYHRRPLVVRVDPRLALGGYAVSAITSVTVQTTLGIQKFHDLPSQVVALQKYRPRNIVYAPLSRSSKGEALGSHDDTRVHEFFVSNFLL